MSDDAGSGKIRLKVGPIEVEYEGSEAFMKDELPKLLGTVAELYKASGGSMSAPPPPSASAAGAGGPALTGTTATIAAKLQVNSGPELIIAAAARLTLGLDQASLSRAQILTEMKTATAYYKVSYSKNLSDYFTTLIKGGKLFESSAGVYALSAGTATELRAKLSA